MRRISSMFAALAFAAALSIPQNAQAQVAAPCTPVASFGVLPGATFSGSGIPNNFVVQSTCGGTTIGLTATPRGSSSPAVTNNGVSTFYGMAGLSAPNRGLWNFDFAVLNANSTDIFTVLLNGHDYSAGIFGSALDRQDSENIAFFGFDPTQDNVPYDVQLVQRDASGQLVQSVDETIIVGTVTTPEPASMVLIATGLLGVGGFARRRNKKLAA